MTEAEFDHVLRKALMDALWEDYQEAIQSADKLDIHFSKDYMHHREKMLMDPFGYAQRESRTVWQRMARFAAMFLLTVSILFGLLMTVPETRAAIVEFYQEWWEDHMDFHFRWDLFGNNQTDMLIRNYHLALLDGSLLPTGFFGCQRTIYLRGLCYK
ncbi:MAG: hypothetical protein IKC24_02030 [Oscillospiraceae bacterium]|nr:hypothetical protein [Oscillospiraceae bacterium]